MGGRKSGEKGERTGHFAQRVLLVEDEEAVAELYRFKLEMDGNQVTVARDGVDAVEAARDAEFDLVLLDIEMPRLDGLGVLKALRGEAATKALAVLVLSNATKHEALLAQARELGVLGWMVKSHTTPRKLADVVRLVAMRRGSNSGVDLSAMALPSGELLAKGKGSAAKAGRS